MYDDDFDDWDGRNARRARLRPPQQRPTTVMVPPRRPGYPVYPPGYGYGFGMGPWTPQPPPASAPAASHPLMDPSTGRLRLGMVLDVAAQVLASMAPLPAAPVVSEDARSNAANLITYQQSLAQHAKRDEQVRTVGALARLFMV